VAALLRNLKININQTNNEGLNAFWIACQQGFSSIMVLLASKKIDLLNRSEHGMNCLHLAVNKNYPDIVRLLLVNYSFPLNHTTNQGLTAVSIAVFRQHHQCLELLINAGADLEVANAQGMTPLQLCLKLRDNFSAKFLIRGGALAYFPEIERQHQSPIFYLVKTQNVVMLEELNNKSPGILRDVRTSDGSSLI